MGIYVLGGAEVVRRMAPRKPRGSHDRSVRPSEVLRTAPIARKIAKPAIHQAIDARIVQNHPTIRDQLDRVIACCDLRLARRLRLSSSH